MKTNRAYGRLMAALLGGALIAAMAIPAAAAEDGQAKATFAGGCFWCVEEAFEQVPGVLSAVSGYTDGHVDSPTYRQVTGGRTGHTEAVEVVFDPAQVTYEQLLDVFWRNVDPTVVDRQFCDVGNQYRTGIFVHDEEQKRLAVASRKALQESKPFPSRSSRPSWRPRRSIPPRITTRITTRSTRCATSSTNGTAGARSAWRSSGARAATASRRRVPS